MRTFTHPTRGALARLLIAGCAGLLAASAHAQAGDARHGADLFETHCSECHSVKEGKDRKGPALYGVVGRKAAQRESFNYSQALRDSQITWTADSLSRYLSNPKAAVPGGKMRYEGLASASERADLIAYLAAQASH